MFDPGADPSEIALDLAVPSGDGHYDELRTPEGGLRPAWEQFFTHLGAAGFTDLDRRAAMLARQIRDDGVSYNVYRPDGGGERPWSLDLLPLIIDADDWLQIEQGVAQRARLLNAVMRDVYGPQRLLRESLVPPALVYGHPGYLRPLAGFMPADGVFLHIVAFDLARGPDGAWWLIGNRTQAPSGLGYALQNRMVVSRLFPEAFRELRVQRLGASFRRLLDMLYRGTRTEGGATARVVLLTPGPYSETYFEHVYLARYLGIPLVEGGDLTVRDDRVFLKTLQGLERVHGILRRLDDDFCDPLELRSDSALGIPGLLQAVRAGQVMVANSFGSGFLESPALHGFLPAISQRMFGEKLLLPSLASWWCGEAAALAQALPQFARMVVKPTSASWARAQGWDSEVAGRLEEAQQQRLIERIRDRPDEHTLQEYLPLSEVAIWRDRALQPRAAMLRVYAVADGEGAWHVLPGGLTRIAGDEQVVTMARGGSSVDTWVLTKGPVETFSMLPGPLSAEALESARRPVTSRAAENLFWMGRYTERAEYGVRLARSTLALLGEDADVPLPLLDTVARLAILQGLVPAGVPLPSKRLAVFERTLIAWLFDESDGRSVAFSVASLARAGEQIRERLSAEHVRLIGQTLAEVRAVREAAVGAGSVITEDEAADMLQQLELRLAAVTGAQADRMTRDEGWRLLTVGRQIERLSTLAGTLQVMFETQHALSGDGFELLLQLADSVITYRARHQRWQHPVALIELLVRDQANPRSLACVVRTLRQELAQLPAPYGEELLARLPPTTQWPSMEMLATVGADGYPHTLLELVETLATAAIGLSESVGSRFFSHAERGFHLVRA